MSHVPWGSYLLVDVSQSQILRNASAASKRKMGVPSLSLGHSARLAKPSPPLSHRGDAQRGQLVAASTRFAFAADSGGPKPERVVSSSVDRLAFEDLEMFWHTARLRGDLSHRPLFAVFVPKRFVVEPQHRLRPCRETETAQHKHHGIAIWQGLAAADTVRFRFLGCCASELPKDILC